MAPVTAVSAFLFLVVVAAPLHASRVLAVFPTVSKSHFDFFQPLLLALASRGHDITVVNSYPQTPPVRNYTDISLQEFKKVFFNDITFDLFPRVPINWMDNHQFLSSQISENEGMFSHPEVQKLLHSKQHFDLVIVELWNSDIFLGFAHKFNAPVIAMSSCNFLPWSNDRFGNPDTPSYVPNIFLRKSGKLDIWYRVFNTLQLVSSKLMYKLFYNPKSESIAKKAFGDSLPPLQELAKKTSLLFINVHHSYFGARPLSPQVVEIGGIHVRDPKPLHKVLFANFYRWSVYDSLTKSMAMQYFGPNVPPMNDIANNASLFLVNSHFQFFAPRPLPPQVVEVGGIHVITPRSLHKDLDRWMNESSEGVIYFSFGSMLRGATLPADKVKAFLQVFESLPQRVLWKWEDDTVEKLPKNVKIMKWIPQRDVLAHPKVKVFISHGGLLGTTEAVVSGVPILGIPMYGDQPNNVAALVENGVAVHVDYNNISVASISYALNALIYDKSYKENANILSQRFLDRPMSPLDTAVYWTEYVIRHRGAPHLQSAAVHLTWYQYYLLDVLAVLTAAVIVILLTIYYIVHSCLRLMCSSKSAKLKSN